MRGATLRGDDVVEHFMATTNHHWLLFFTTAGRVYSARRLRIVVALLSLIFLPIVVGASLLIYQYMVFSVMVEQRLTGEKGRLPSRVYARPLVVRPGLVLAPDGLVKLLNGLRYAEREAAPAEAGQFSVSPAGVTLFPRPVDSGWLARNVTAGTRRATVAAGSSPAIKQI